MEELKQYLDEHKDRFLEELIDFLKIPSISADPAYKGEVKKAAEWLKERYLELDLDNVEVT